MQCKGMTLLELLVTLSIAALLLAVASPSFSGWMAKSRLRSAAYDLLTDIQKTRSEAVMRSARITLWNTADNDWSSGWEMFIDSDEDGVRDPGEPLLYQRNDRDDTLEISGNTPVATMVSYQASGESVRASGAFQAGTLTLCASGLDTAYQIIINNVGRPQMITSNRSAAGCS